MNFLLDNPIAAMEGTSFLVLFVVFIVITLFTLAVAKSTLDNTDRLPIPAIPPELDPYEVAYLRSGTNELARSVIFSLVQKGFVEVVSDGKMGFLRRTDNRVEARSLPQIEQIALGWIAAERVAKEVFDKSKGLIRELEPACAQYQIVLSSRQFLMPPDLVSRAKKFGLTAAALIVGLGGYKVFASILTGHFNVIFTIVITTIAFIIAMTIGQMPRMTKLGKQYLERLQLAFEDLKYRSQAPYIGTENQRPAIAEAGFASVDPLLLSVGVFGTGILAGTAFSGYNDAFHRAQQQGAWSSSGCGSACGSSCSSGDGGSGCSSGCGGGGCGGGGCGG